MSARLDCAFDRIDAFNRGDPNGKELIYGRRMSDRLDQFEPGASEELRIAARAQHIGRWRIPRGNYPMDRRGYKAWRTELAKLHAQTAAEILRECGYGGETIERVSSLLQKKKLKVDPEAQTLEDVACLVFLEHYFAEFAAQHSDEKVIRILQRTWIKMSGRGRDAALKLPLTDHERSLVERALA